MATDKVTLGDVFNPGGMPSVTYVERSSLGLERQLNSALARGGAIVTVSGPTKSGKTVLCRKVLDTDSLWLDGGDVTSNQSFWEFIREHLDEPSIRMRSESASRESGASDISGGVSIGIASIGGSKGSPISRYGQTHTDGFSGASIRRLRNGLIEAKSPIVIDDFHFIKPDTQREIINSLKPAIFDGLQVIFIAVPHRASDPLAVQGEMQGRFHHLEVTPWDVEELYQIPAQGFPALNCAVSRSEMEEICGVSYNNPLIRQDICFRLCEAVDVLERQPVAQVITTGDLANICELVAQHSGFPIFEKLARGPKRAERKKRRLRKGGALDIYPAIMLSVVENGANSVTTYDQIRSSLRDLLIDGDIPQKNEVNNACGYMSEISKTGISSRNVEPVEWHNDKFIISDPFLLFYMRWRSVEIRERILAEFGGTPA